MPVVPVLEFQHLEYKALREYELDSALGYAHTCYEQDLDRNLLRILINTTHSRRKSGTALAFLAANVIKQNVRPPDNPTPEQAEDYDLLYRACKGAVMHAMSIRSVWARANRKKRSRGTAKKAQPLEDLEHSGQFRLFS